MSGRHRKPTKTAVRLARAGALTVMATAPLAITGSAMAAPMAPTDRDSGDWAGLNHSSSRSDDSDWGGDSSDGDSSDGDSDDADSSTFNRSDYAHAADDDSPSWRGDSDDSDSDDADSASSSDDDSPQWTYAEPHSSRSDSARSSRDDDDSLTPSRAHRQSTPRASRGLSGRHSEPATPQATDAKWDKLAQCESTQNWDSNTGNGYKGGLQFDDRTWRNYGGTKYAPSADQASRDEQIAVAKKVQQQQGWHAWPGCSHKLGYA